MSSDELRRRIEYFKDLGVKDLYKREAAAPVVEAAPVTAAVSETAAPVVELPSLAPAGDSLIQIGEDIGDCRRCRLHAGRN
ncbi:MAG TPA: hypothetical protein VHC72_15070, partial [Bryobacteraceae bacterium]|nr:hypothetical protein [Bryobacteraceae bacterium]